MERSSRSTDKHRGHMERNFLKGLEKEIKLFEDRYNPLQFYCHLRNIGIEKDEAKRMGEIYEIGIYKEIMIIRVLHIKNKVR